LHAPYILAASATVALEHAMAEFVKIGSKTALKAIDGVRDAHVAALNAGDAQAWVMQFTDDAVQMPPNAPANVGRAKIASWSQGFLHQFDVRFALNVAEVQVAGEWAFESGSYTISVTAKAGGPTINDSGKYITLYEKQPAGAWRMARDIWNSDNPPHPM
jgi:uncharacterized protein (TIGR02246 family)